MTPEKKQEIFTKVAKHLLTQGQRAVAVEGSPACRYRGMNNTKCAIGCLIPDELYEEQMEGHSAASLLGNSGYFPKHYYCEQNVDKNTQLRALLGIEEKTEQADLSFLSYMQYVHDAVHKDFWRIRLVDFAVNNRLTMPEGV